MAAFSPNALALRKRGGDAFDPSLDYSDDSGGTPAAVASDAMRPTLLRQGETASSVPGGNRGPGISPIDPEHTFMKDLQDVSGRLEAAYAAPRPSMARQVIGAFLSKKNPQLGGLVSGETQREHALEPLQQQYGMLAQQILANRAQHTADMQNNLRQTNIDALKQGMTTQAVDTGDQVFNVPTKNIGSVAGRAIGANASTANTNARIDSTETQNQNKLNSEESIAADRMASAERIAKGRNLVSQENAKLKASMQNDPNALTNAMKTQKQQAQATLPEIEKAQDETEKVAGLLGPVQGRWNDFMQGKVGAPSPEFAHYADEIGMISTAVTLAHARGRMSNELFEHFQKMFDAGKQSPENMIQALNVAHEWLSGYANMGEPGSTVGGGRRGTATGGGRTGAQSPPAGAKIRDYTDLGKK